MKGSSPSKEVSSSSSSSSSSPWKTLYFFRGAENPRSHLTAPGFNNNKPLFRNRAVIKTSHQGRNGTELCIFPLLPFSTYDPRFPSNNKKSWCRNNTVVCSAKIFWKIIDFWKEKTCAKNWDHVKKGSFFRRAQPDAFSWALSFIIFALCRPNCLEAGHSTSWKRIWMARKVPLFYPGF